MFLISFKHLLNCLRLFLHKSIGTCIFLRTHTVFFGWCEFFWHLKCKKSKLLDHEPDSSFSSSSSILDLRMLLWSVVVPFNNVLLLPAFSYLKTTTTNFQWKIPELFRIYQKLYLLLLRVYFKDTRIFKIRFSLFDALWCFENESSSPSLACCLIGIQSSLHSV